jgi:two-component system NtrC family sensor kinase
MTDESNAELPAVLIVDDVEANLKVLQLLLEGQPCNVVAAGSGQQALRLLLRQEFAVLLLDVQMPEMDGYEVARHVRMHPATRDVPIIFLTATHHTDENILRGYDSGAVDFLFKPLNPVVLLSKVRVFLELHAQRKKLACANRELEHANGSLRQSNQELENAYHDVKTAHAQLVQSAKMASLGELVAGVAHEINNPLSFALNHLGTTRRSLEQFRVDLAAGDSQRAEERWQRAGARLNETEHGLERIRDLVLKLRAFSRLDEGERKVVSIAECIDSVLMILGHRLQDRVRVTLELGPVDWVDCYPALLNQVLLNLVANSIDAIEGSGSITLRTGVEDGMFVISVTDTGCGIPNGMQDRIFEPFFTTKPVGQGTGLGLSIAYSIVKKHEGTLELRAASEGGTIATIRIPLSNQSAA